MQARMDIKRTRLRSQIASKRAPQVSIVARKYPAQPSNDIVDVEVEGEDDRFLPVVYGVKKRKRDPRGGGRRQHQKLESQEGSVPVFVAENADNVGEDVKETDRYLSDDSPDEEEHSGDIDGAHQFSASTIVIIPDIMAEDQAVMNNLDKRRESSRLRVKPSKFREGFLLNDSKSKVDQKGPDDSPNSLEIVLPVDTHQTMQRSQQGGDLESLSFRSGEDEDTSEKTNQFSTARSKLKVTLGTSKAADRRKSTAHTSLKSIPPYDEQGLKTALAVVKRVMQIKSADPFNEPVDPVSLEIPDYFDVIKEPMDLGTIRDLLETGKKYRTVREVYADVQLIWSNCRSYNQEGDPIMDIMRIAETVFNKHWNAAGLHLLSSDTTVKDDAGEVEDGEEQAATPEQAQSEGSKARGPSDDKRSSRRVSQLDSNTIPRLKTKRSDILGTSASVEHLMAECKAREDIQDANGQSTRNANLLQSADDNVASQRIAGEMIVDNHMLSSPSNFPAQTPQRTSGNRFGQPIGHRDGGGVNQSEGQSATDTPVQEDSKMRVEDADNATRTASSNKRRTFGTVHHKPDCSCVVCVGRRRKLAREGKEGMTPEGSSKKAKSRSRLPPKNLEGTENAAGPTLSQVDDGRPTQPQSSDLQAANVSAEKELAEANQSERQGGNAPGAEMVVEGVRYYPANYEVPLRKLNASLFKLSKSLFGSQDKGVWTRRGGYLGFRDPPPSSRSSMLDAVHSLTLSEKL